LDQHGYRLLRTWIAFFACLNDAEWPLARLVCAIASSD
jgi:hypothetical protein